jgi:hypothetical protein
MSMDAMTLERTYGERLTRVWARLEDLAGRTPTAGRLTDPDPSDEERWDWGQVWAHIAEFPGYWLDQLAKAMKRSSGKPPKFGRTRTDPARIAAIEADRSVPVADLWGRIEPQLARLGTTLEAFADEDWGFEVTHPTLGVMAMPAILDRFLVGHLEEHAQQLESLVQ